MPLGVAAVAVLSVRAISVVTGLLILLTVAASVSALEVRATPVNSAVAGAIAGFSAFAGQPAAWPIHGVLLAWHALILARAGRPADALAVLDGWLDVALAWADADTRQQLVSALSSESST
jgi:hypothetical protein